MTVHVFLLVFSKLNCSLFIIFYNRFLPAVEPCFALINFVAVFAVLISDQFCRLRVNTTLIIQLELFISKTQNLFHWINCQSMAANQIHFQNENIFHASHENRMSNSQLTNTDFYPCFTHDRRRSSSYSFQSDRFGYRFYIFSSYESLTTVGPLPLVTFLIFTSLAPLFSPANPFPRVLAPFRYR